MSTSRVYSISEIKKKYTYSKKFLINEKFSTESPISIYGFTKLASEKLIEELSYSNGVDYIINRFGVISGPLAIWSRRSRFCKSMVMETYEQNSTQLKL